MSSNLDQGSRSMHISPCFGLRGQTAIGLLQCHQEPESWIFEIGIVQNVPVVPQVLSKEFDNVVHKDHRITVRAPRRSGAERHHTDAVTRVSGPAPFAVARQPSGRQIRRTAPESGQSHRQANRIIGCCIEFRPAFVHFTN